MRKLLLQCFRSFGMAAALVVFGFGFTGLCISQRVPDEPSMPSLDTGPIPPEGAGVRVLPVEPGEDIPDWLARWELGRVLSYMKRYDEAVAQYERVLTEKPGLLEAKVELAKILYWKGEQAAAARVLEEIPLEQMTEETQVLMADLFVARKEYEKAAPLYKKYLKEHPEDQSVRLKLAELLSWQKQYDASLAQYRKILEAAPGDDQVRRRYAFVLIWSGRHAEAAAELKKTLD